MSDQSETNSSSENDVLVDWSRVKKFFSGGASRAKEGHEEGKQRSELSRFFSNIRTYQIILLVLVALFVSVYFREYPVYLPATHDWAQNSVHNSIRNQLGSQVAAQFPNLPDERKQAYVNEQFDNFLEQNRVQVDQQIEQVQAYFKSQLQNEWGHTYILDIDPYHQYRQARYVIEQGHPGNKVVDGKFIDTQKYPPIGVEIPRDLLQYTIAFLYYILIIFHVWTHEHAVFLAAYHAPVVIAALCVIPAFFLTRRIAGNLGGFVAAIMVGIVPQFIARTAAGVPDTDGFNVLMPLMVTWLYLECFESTGWRRKIIMGSLAGLFVGLFSFIWEGWWYIFVILLVATIGYLVFYVGTQVVIHNNRALRNFVKSDQIRTTLAIAGIFILASAVFVSVLDGPSAFFSAPFNALNPKKAIGKNVAEKDIFPKIHTTVAELNEASISQVISQVGGKFYYILAIMGILLIIIREEKNLIKSALMISLSLLWYFLMHTSKSFGLIGGHFFTYILLIMIPAFVIMLLVHSSEVTPYKRALILLIWLAVSIYATLNGVRFLLLLVPAFAVGFGTCMGILYEYIRSYVDSEVKQSMLRTGMKVASVLLILTILITPVKAAHQTAKMQVPLINKAWVTALEKIRDDSKPDAIINSWWDYGHWFITVANRSATFDGSVQRGTHAYFIGRSFLTNDEKVTVGILRMLDCGAATGFSLVNAQLNDQVRSIDVINSIILLDREAARAELLGLGIGEGDVEAILERTHCDPPENYYIASDDMIGKSGVWGHFGSWDFRRASMYLETKRLKQADGVVLLKEKYGLSDEDAFRTYNEVQTTAADTWIAPWPSFGGSSSCSMQEPDSGLLRCENGLEVDLVHKRAGVKAPDGKFFNVNKLVIADAQGNIDVAEFSEDLIERQSGRPLGVTMIPRSTTNYLMVLADPAQSDSMFVRLYWMEGRGLKYFRLFTYESSFTGNQIFVYKVHWNGDAQQAADSGQDNDLVEERIAKGLSEGIIDISSLIGEDKQEESNGEEEVHAQDAVEADAEQVEVA